MQTTGRQNTRGCVIAAVCLSLLAGFVLCGGREQTQVNRGLKILYAGRPGSDRERDFVGFLREYFDVVRTGDLQVFPETDAQGFDVTILDWDWNDLRGPRPMLSPSFSRPIMTLGVAGGFMCRRWRV